MNNRYVLAVVIIVLLVASVLFGYQQGRAKPLKQGVIWAVVTGEGDNQYGMYRENPAGGLPQMKGSAEYGLDMYGVLYPTHLEVRFPNNQTRIIPFNKITHLEFGAGRVTFDKK